MRKRKSNSKKIVLMLALVFLVALVYYITTLSTEEVKTNQNIKEQIMTRLGLTNESVNITKLGNLTGLKQKYPVIYENAKEGDYEIRTENKLIIYDYEKDRIVKEFDVTNIKIV
jgi:sensor domain CHASE-containing protein